MKHYSVILLIILNRSLISMEPQGEGKQPLSFAKLYSKAGAHQHMGAIKAMARDDAIAQERADTQSYLDHLQNEQDALLGVIHSKTELNQQLFNQVRTLKNEQAALRARLGELSEHIFTIINCPKTLREQDSPLLDKVAQFHAIASELEKLASP